MWMMASSKAQQSQFAKGLPVDESLWLVCEKLLQHLMMTPVPG
jgi:hypothetical protein